MKNMFDFIVSIIFYLINYLLSYKVYYSNYKGSILFRFLLLWRDGLPIEFEASELDSVRTNDQILRQNDLEEQARQEWNGTEKQAK